MSGAVTSHDAKLSPLPPIPWSHSSADEGSVWRWVTPDFTVVVNGDSRSFYWVLSDTSTSPDMEPRPFADGSTATFEQAERAIRETIGKAYPPRMGYQHFAGPLATTFILADGKAKDLEPFIGRRVTVKVADRGWDGKPCRGVASVEHYDLILTTPEEIVRISPSYIVDIVPDGTGVKAPSMRKAAPVSPFSTE